MAFPPGTKLLEADRITIIPKKIVMAQMRKLARALRKQPALAFSPSKPCQTPCHIMDATIPPTTSSHEPQKPLTPPLTSTNYSSSPKWGETIVYGPIDDVYPPPLDSPAPPETEATTTTTPLPTLLAETLFTDIGPEKPAAIQHDESTFYGFNARSPLSTSSSDDDTKKPRRPPLSHIIRAVNAVTNASLSSDLPAPPETEATTPLPTLLAEPLLKDIKPVKPAAITLQPDEVLDHNSRPRKKMPHEMPFSPLKSENERPKLKAVKRKVPPPPEPKSRKAGLKEPDANRWGDFKIPRKQ